MNIRYNNFSNGFFSPCSIWCPTRARGFPQAVGFLFRNPPALILLSVFVYLICWFYSVLSSPKWGVRPAAILWLLPVYLLSRSCFENWIVLFCLLCMLICSIFLLMNICCMHTPHIVSIWESESFLENKREALWWVTLFIHPSPCMHSLCIMHWCFFFFVDVIIFLFSPLFTDAN